MTAFANIVSTAIAAALTAALAHATAHAAGKTMPAPKVTIYPGDPIDDALIIDIVFTERSVRRMHAFEDRAQLTGLVARRTLVAGQPIPVNAVRKPETVSQGKRYMIVFEQSGLVITGSGVALQSGAVGDTISLRNVDSGTTISGVIRSDGSVKVGTP